MPRKLDNYHGTYGGYNNHACRCAACKRANADEGARQKAKHAAELAEGRPQPHGVYSTYTNYECRCQRCRDAAAKWARDRRRRKAELEQAA